MRRVDAIIQEFRRGNLRPALEEILYRHSVWEATEGKKGERLDLSGANLRKANLREARLDEADCKFTVFLNADFDFADLRGVDTGKSHTDPRPHTRAGIPIEKRSARLRQSLRPT